MISGEKRFKHLLFGLATLGVFWVGASVLPDIAAGIQYPDVGQSERLKELSLEQLTKSLALNPIHHVQFDEIYVSHFLTAPIKKSGRLSYTAPSKFEKHIVSPTEESFVIDEDVVHYHNVTQGVNQTLSLQDVPSLQVFIIGLRSLFSGDLKTLHRYYQPKLNGTYQRWVLTLIPLDEDIQDSVQFIRLKGIKIQIKEIEIQESNGDRSTLFLEKL